MLSTVGFIGTGNMGGALVRAAAASRRAETILLANRNPDKAAALKEALGGGASIQVTANQRVAESCQLIFLGVKPQMMAGMLGELTPILRERRDRFVLATMAAGMTCAQIRELAGVDCPVIRLMPNTPSAIGAGVIQYCGLDATEEELAEFAALMAPAGLVERLEERLIDAASAVSGCGPAFVYLFIEALADGGVACGLPRDQAVRYAAQMVQGSARMVLESGRHPGALKDAVCSPGGTTIQGVRTLEEGGFRAAAMNAVIKAYERTLELK